jgi:DNA-binding phage protein
MRILYEKDVVRLLRLKVKQAGGQSEWARKSGVPRTLISMVLSGDRPPSNKKILNALRLRRAVVFLPYSK